MQRCIRLCSISGVFAVVAAGFALAAPAPKENDKPLPPATPAQWQTSTNNLKDIGLAMHNYNDTVGNLPSNKLTKDGKPGLSWRVLLLPYIEENDLYQEFKLDEPWDSDHNVKLVEKLPKVYAPVRGRAENGRTFYQMFSGERTLLDPTGMIGVGNIPDGRSNTFMVTEGAKAVIWTKPDDLPFDGKKVPALGGMFDGEFNVLMGDGSVKRFSPGVDPDVLRRGIDRADGEIVDFDAAIKKAKSKD